MIRSLTSCLFAAALLLAGCSRTGTPDQGPLVLAAASMQEALGAAAAVWEAKGHPAPVLSFAATSALARQVESGAAGDLFVSADETWMAELVADGFIARGKHHRLAANRLALVAPAASTVTLALEPGRSLAPVLASGRLAMADPDAVPAGRYGKQALASLGAWDDVRTKLAIGENVRVALTLVSRGEAPLGIVYSTDAQADPGVRIVALFPATSHAPIVYPIGQLAASTHPDAAAFEAFLLSGEGQAIFRRFGFETD